MRQGDASPALHSAIALIVAIVAAASIVIGAQTGYGAIAGGTSWLEGISPAVLESVFTLLVFGTLAGIAWAALALRADPEHHLIGADAGRMAAIGLALGTGGVIAAIALSWLAGVVVPGSSDAAADALLVGTVVILIQASAEEYYFRGWLQPVLQRGWGRWPGLVAASVAFALLHLAGGAVSALAIANLLIGGLWFGVLAERSGGIVLPALAHFGWNWTESIGFGLGLNPGVGSFGSIVDVDLAGVAHWGGSEEGLNASIGMTFVLVALLVATFGWRQPVRPSAAALSG